MLSDKDEPMVETRGEEKYHSEKNRKTVEKHQLEKRCQAEENHRIEKKHHAEKRHHAEADSAVKRKIYWIMSLKNVNQEKRMYAFTTDENVLYRMLWQKMTLILGADVREITYDRGFKYPDVLINSDESLALAIEFMGRDSFDFKKGIQLNVKYYNDHSD